MLRSPLLSKPTDPKREGECDQCGKGFLKLRPLQRVCSPVCASKKVRAVREAEQRQEREKVKARKAALQRIPDLIKIAQREFNVFIRLRDKLAGHSCISSGAALDWSGNGVDAGHYRSVGAAPHLRFDERNCHAQSKRENQWRAGNAVDYRIGLIARIGLAEVEALEADNKPRHWTREELKSIAATYRAKTRELKARE